jgi:hypothetical protein
MYNATGIGKDLKDADLTVLRMHIFKKKNRTEGPSEFLKTEI